jgi:stringent starvation protein B
MTINLFQTAQYRELMTKHISDTIGYFFDKNQEFSIVCEVKHTSFNPELPSDLKATFKETVMFIVSGYTFETSSLEDQYFSFEAGFGQENFGSTVTVPLLAITQIFTEETPVLINHAKPQEEKERRKESSQKSAKSSMEALLSNPENKKLLKRKK